MFITVRVLFYFIFYIFGVGWDWVHLARRSLPSLLYQPRTIDDECEAVAGMRNGKGKYSEKTCPSATLSTTNPTWPNLGSNLGRRCGKPANNRLRYGTASLVFYCSNSTSWLQSFFLFENLIESPTIFQYSFSVSLIRAYVYPGNFFESR
jgi:hypothetical protein